MQAASKEPTLLDAALAYSGTYLRHGLSLSSHLPMVLTAAHSLGLPQPSQAAQLAHWQARLPPVTADEVALREALMRELAGADRHQQLRAHLPTFMAAPESQAFHLLIRLAYAWRSGHEGEWVAALAHGAMFDESLGPWTSAGVATARADAVLQALPADAAMAFTPATNTSIFTDMQAVWALPATPGWVSAARPTLAELAALSLAAYLGSHDFTALHLVTGVHAARVLIEAAAEAPGPRLDHWLALLWRAWLCAYVSCGSPPLNRQAVHVGRAGEADWQAALPGLAASLNDHRIKLADAAREEWRHYGWPGYASCLEAKGAAR